MVNKNLKNNEYCDGYNYNNYKDKVETGKDLYYDDFANCTLKKSLEGLIGSLYRPQTHTSTDYKNWIAVLDMGTCIICRNLHGKIFSYGEKPEREPPVHERCRCRIEKMLASFIGMATKDGKDGVDVYLSINGALPNNYITKKQAQKLGWINFLGNLGVVAPDKIIGGDIYHNRNGHLPESPGRIWYEADINYDFGYRNHHRLIFSNDGLMFATYDHYLTFVQIH